MQKIWEVTQAAELTDVVKYCDTVDLSCYSMLCSVHAKLP